MRRPIQQIRKNCPSWSFFILTVCLLLCSAASFATPTSALLWLATKNNPDGSYGTEADMATSYQATAEVLHSSTLLNQNTQSNFAAALAFINAENLHNTEYLSRKIMANAEAGNGVSSMLDELKAIAGPEGGFGEFAEFQPTVLDTAFALQALHAAASGSSDAAIRALAYLIGQQKSNGGWSDGGNVSNVYTTALAVKSIIPYVNQYAQAAQSVNAAGSFLLSQQNATGLWVTDFESAQALLALAQSLPDNSNIAPSVSALIARQQDDGSWDGDVYTTALALQLLSVLENPIANPSLSALKGRVIDGGTGYALSGVTVSVEGSVSKQIVSDPDGNFELAEMPPGQYAI
jgi:hypothetical protein